MEAAILTVLLVLFSGQEVRAQALQIRPELLDFDLVKVGAEAKGNVFLTNARKDELEVEIHLVGDGFSIDSTSMKLGGGEEKALEVRFSAAEPGTYEGEVVFQISGFLKSEKFSVPLRASAALPHLHMNPDPSQVLYMGSLPLGEASRKNITLRNDGKVPFSLKRIALSGDTTSFQVTAPAQQVELAPGESLEIEVEFAPEGGGECESRLLVVSDDLAEGSTEFALKGEGRAPKAVFSPLPEVGMSFGDLSLGQSRVLRLTVLNRGQADLRIDSLETSSGAFVASFDSAVTVPPDGRAEIPVRFRPKYEGRTSGRMIVYTNDPKNPEVEILLSGTAQQRPPKIELLTPALIDFGNVAIGKQERDYLVVWNRGGTPFTVTMDIEGDADAEFSIEAPSVLLQPGEFEKVVLEFSPKETGERRVVLWVRTESGRKRIDLYGVGKFLELHPTTVDFDRVVVGKISGIQTEIYNYGNADFTITNITTSNPKVFSVKSQVSPTNKFILSAGGLRSLPVSITFSPPARGVFNGVLQVQGYWDEAFETREILLNGIGIAADLELHPSGPFEFGYVVLGEKQARTIIATNTGDTDLRVEAHSETPEAYIEPSRFVLEPGQSTTLKLVFSPTELGKRNSRVRLISNDVKEKAITLQVTGKGELDNVDLAKVVLVVVSRKTRFDTLKVYWNNTPVVLPDQTKIDLVFQIPDSLRRQMVGRKFGIEWIQLDQNYDEQGGPKKIEVQIQDAGEARVLAEKLNLRLTENANPRVRLKVSTQNHPGAPSYSISQIFEAGGWKWEFEAKPLVSFLSIRPGKKYRDREGNLVKGKTERLIGLPGFAFFGWHNSGSPSISGIHLTAIGNVLEALSTENSIAVSLGFSVSLYKDRFMFGLGWDVYDHRPKAQRKGTVDYIMTFKYWGLF